MILRNIQLNLKIKFTYLKKIDRLVKMRITVMPISKRNKLSEIIFGSIFFKYQTNIFEKMNKNELVFDYVNYVVSHFHNTTLKSGGLLIEGYYW